LTAGDILLTETDTRTPLGRTPWAKAAPHSYWELRGAWPSHLVCGKKQRSAGSTLACRPGPL